MSCERWAPTLNLGDINRQKPVQKRSRVGETVHRLTMTESFVHRVRLAQLGSGGKFSLFDQNTAKLVSGHNDMNLQPCRSR